MSEDTVSQDTDQIISIAEHALCWGTPSEIVRLSGLTNRNYLIRCGGDQAVVRLPGVGTSELVDRQGEKEITQVASKIGVDNELLHFDALSGVKAVRYIENARTMTSSLAKEPDITEKIADALRRLHTCGETVSVDFDVFEKIDEYEFLIDKEGGRYWDDYRSVRERVFALQPIAGKRARVICHNDPLCENFVMDEQSGRMYLIDWEYAGMNNPLWDLADVIIEAAYDDCESRAFVSSYFGREATPEEDVEIAVNMVLLDFLWSLWGKQRSCFGEDLEAYADERFQRAKDNLEKLRTKGIA